jgi:hypothetical protein
VVPGLVIHQLGRAGVGQYPGGVKADEISRVRLSKRNNQAIGACDKEQRGNDLDRDQYLAIEEEAPTIEEIAGRPERDRAVGDEHEFPDLRLISD